MEESKKFINMLQDVQDTLLAVNSDNLLDDAILRGVRNLAEIKAFFKNSSTED